MTLVEAPSRDGGNFAMIIHAVGPYDSDVSDGNDADRVLTQFTAMLRDAGHEIRSVTLVTGSRIRNVVRDRSGGYVLAEAPESLPEPDRGLDPAVLDPVAVQAGHDEAVAGHDEAVRERAAAAAAAEQDTAARHREAAAGRPGHDEAGGEQETSGSRRSGHPRFAAGGDIPAGHDGDDASPPPHASP